ncbi:MAG: tetratricopeptide repeat protein [Bacteroidia bacterium]|jgi:predicted Zn-dependent protease|nr:tetratricopeptide repeat protein [Bacteroidia bacterium]
MSANTTRLLLILGALLLFVLLFISPRQKTRSGSEAGIDAASAKPMVTAKKEALAVFLKQAVNALSPELRKNHDAFQANKHVDSLTVFWDKQKRPDLAAYYTEALAEKKDSASAWYKAGNRYYYSIPFVKDESEIPLLYKRAVFCFDKSLKQDSLNTDAKIMLGACMVEGSEDPMKGISLLRAIEKTDSNNVKLQMTFALFSVKSGQLEKAVVRFKKVLQIDSAAIEVYLHLADAYEKLNQPQLSLKMLETYQSKTTDPIIKMEIGKYIDQLRNSN